MLRELISILRDSKPLNSIGERFAQMLRISFDQVVKAGAMYFGEAPVTEGDRQWVYEQDIQVNQLERSIRKQLITHLAVPGNAMDVPYCLLLMSLVKDVERIGDYAKNLSEVREFCGEPFARDHNLTELGEIRSGVEAEIREAFTVLEEADREKALELVRQGRGLAQRCDALITKIAQSDYDACMSTALVLGARYYKRIGGHALNILSSVIMPLHRLDFFDEAEAANLNL